jgi:hypothetical protein
VELTVERVAAPPRVKPLDWYCVKLGAAAAAPLESFRTTTPCAATLLAV